jgi:hypothetical protein
MVGVTIAGATSGVTTAGATSEVTTAGATSEVTIAGATDADAIQQNSSCDQLLWRDRDARLRRTPAQTFCLTTLRVKRSAFVWSRSHHAARSSAK